MNIRQIKEASRRAMPPAMEPSRVYWLAMLAASAFGTNLGDLWSDILFANRWTSLACLMAMVGVAIGWDRWGLRRDGGAGYWVTIVLMRAAATNLADLLTHDVGLGYGPAAALLAILTAAAAWFTHSEVPHGMPRVDGAYWSSMFLAGLFGTVAGDLVAHGMGLYATSVLMCCILGGLVRIREARLLPSSLLYWAIIMAERCAGTALGDALASRRTLALGVPTACICTCVLTLTAVALQTSRRRQPGGGSGTQPRRRRRPIRSTDVQA